MKYNVYARRSSNDDWTMWTSTFDEETALLAVDRIEHYEYEWKCDGILDVTSFKTECYKLGANPKIVDKYIQGRRYLTKDEAKEVAGWRF